MLKKLVSFVGVFTLLGVERRVHLAPPKPDADSSAVKNGGLLIEGVTTDDALAILAALDKGPPSTPVVPDSVKVAAVVPAPEPAPEKPKPSEPAVVPAAAPEVRRRRAAPPPPPPAADDDEDEDEDEQEEEDEETDEDEEEETNGASTPPPIPDELRAPAVPMKKFVLHFQQLGLKTEAQMQAALVALVPQCPSLAKIGEEADILRRLQQTRTILNVKD